MSEQGVTGAGDASLIDHVIQVRPADGGWLVESPLTGGPIKFACGEAAQGRARVLARCVAGMGLDVRVMVHDASEALRSTARYFADDPDGAEAMAAAFATAITLSQL